MSRIAVLGTGLLGSGVVENLLHKRHQVQIWNRSPQKLAPLVALGAEAAADPAAAVRGCERVHLVLAEDDAVDAVIAALLPGLGAGTPIIDHSTNAPARVAERCRRLGAQQVRYVHAPMMMAPQHAREAVGLMLVAGPDDLVRPLLDPLGEMTGKVWHCGERGDLAAIHKLSGNMTFFALTGLIADLFAMGDAAGVDPKDVMAMFEVFKPAAALPSIGERVAQTGKLPVTFELEMGRKDLRLAMETAGPAASLIVLPALADAMDRALAAGHSQDDLTVFAQNRRDRPRGG